MIDIVDAYEKFEKAEEEFAAAEEQLLETETT